MLDFNCNFMAKVFRPRYLLPVVYFLFALFVIISEWDDGGFLSRLGTNLVTAPWSAWIPDYLNYMYWDLIPGGHLSDTNISILIIGVSLNILLLYGFSRLAEWAYHGVKSSLT